MGEISGWIKGSTKRCLSMRRNRMGMTGAVTQIVRACCSTIICCFWVDINVGQTWSCHEVLGYLAPVQYIENNNKACVQFL